MTKKEKKYFEKATHMAANSNMDVKMGCVITYKGKIISESCNQFKTHPLQAEYDVEREDFEEGHPHAHSLHAESAALLKIKDLDLKWNKVEIYISRPLKCRPYGLAKPCKACEKLIKDMGIRKIHYTSDENSFITEEWIDE